MAILVNAGDLLSVRITYTNVATVTAMNVLHYRVGSLTGAVPDIDTFLTAVAGQLLTLWSPRWAAAASDKVELVGIAATSVFPLPRSVTKTAFPGVAKMGDINSDALPLQDSITILKRTAIGNKTGLGRLYYVGLPESEQANGIISAAEVANLTNLINWISSSPAVNGGPWSCVLNPCLVNGPEDNPARITNITSSALSNTIIKTQRRRRPGKGI